MKPTQVQMLEFKPVLVSPSTANKCEFKNCLVLLQSDDKCAYSYHNVGRIRFTNNLQVQCTSWWAKKVVSVHHSFHLRYSQVGMSLKSPSVRLALFNTCAVHKVGLDPHLYSIGETGVLTCTWFPESSAPSPHDLSGSGYHSLHTNDSNSGAQTPSTVTRTVPRSKSNPGLALHLIRKKDESNVDAQSYVKPHKANSGDRSSHRHTKLRTSSDASSPVNVATPKTSPTSENISLSPRASPENTPLRKSYDSIGTSHPLSLTICGNGLDDRSKSISLLSETLGNSESELRMLSEAEEYGKESEKSHEEPTPKQFDLKRSRREKREREKREKKEKQESVSESEDLETPEDASGKPKLRRRTPSFTTLLGYHEPLSHSDSADGSSSHKFLSKSVVNYSKSVQLPNASCKGMLITESYLALIFKVFPFLSVTHKLILE